MDNPYDSESLLYKNVFIPPEDLEDLTPEEQEEFIKYFKKYVKTKDDTEKADLSKMPIKKVTSYRRSVVLIDSKFRNKQLYPKQNNFVFTFPRKYNNVASIKLIQTIIPNTDSVIKDQPLELRNNRIYWINQEDVDLFDQLGYFPIYSVSLKPGNYNALSIVDEITDKMNNVLRRNGDPNAPYHYFNISCDLDTDVFEFVSLKRVLLPANPFKTIINTNIIEVNHPGHGYLTGQIVYFSGSQSVSGFSADYINNKFVINVIDPNTYSFQVNTSAVSDSQTGGNSVFASVDSPFKFLWGEYTDTVGFNLGFSQENSSELIDINNPITTFEISIIDFVFDSNTNTIQIKTKDQHYLKEGQNIKIRTLRLNNISYTVSEVIDDYTFTISSNLSLDLSNGIVYTPNLKVKFTNHKFETIKFIGDYQNNLVTVKTTNSNVSYKSGEYIYIKSIPLTGYFQINKQEKLINGNFDTIERPGIYSKIKVSNGIILAKSGNDLFLSSDNGITYSSVYTGNDIVDFHIEGKKVLIMDNGPNNEPFIITSKDLMNTYMTINYNDSINTSVSEKKYLGGACSISKDGNVMAIVSYDISAQVFGAILINGLWSDWTSLTDYLIVKYIPQNIPISLSTNDDGSVIALSVRRDLDNNILFVYRDNNWNVSNIPDKNIQDYEPLKAVVSDDGNYITLLTAKNTLLSYKGRMFRSSDKGTTFSQVISGPITDNMDWNDITMSNNGMYQLASTISDVYLSLDYGQSWTNINTINGVSNLWLSDNLENLIYLSYNSVYVWDYCIKIEYNGGFIIDGNEGFIGYDDGLYLYNLQSPVGNIGNIDLNNINNTLVRVSQVIDKDNFVISTPNVYTKLDNLGGNEVRITSYRHGFFGTQNNKTTETMLNRPISLQGFDYIYMCSPQLEGTVDNNANIKDAFAIILLNQPPGSVIFNSFIDNPKIYYESPLPVLEKLQFIIRNPTGSLFDFNNIDYSFTLEIIEVIDTFENSNISSQRGETYDYRTFSSNVN